MNVTSENISSCGTQPLSQAESQSADGEYNFFEFTQEETNYTFNDPPTQPFFDSQPNFTQENVPAPFPDHMGMHNFSFDPTTQPDFPINLPDHACRLLEVHLFQIKSSSRLY